MKKNLFLILITYLALPQLGQAQCSPVTAKICVAGDDNSQVWVNGYYLGEMVYCDGKSGCNESKLCFPVPLEKFPGQKVFIAVKTINKNPVDVFSSWVLNVTCADGRPFVVTSENPAHAGISLYWDPTGGSNCGLGTPPPLDGKGNSWTDINYNPATNPFTLTGDQVTANTWSAAHLQHPLTGVVIPFISYDPSAAGVGPNQGCGVLYWRQIAKLPAWVYTATPTAYSPPTRAFTSTPTEALPPIIPILTPTPKPMPTATSDPKHTRRLLPTPIPTPRMRYTPSPEIHRYQFQPTATFVYRRPTRTPTPIPLPTWRPTPTFMFKKPTPVPIWLTHLDKAHAVVFQTPPVEINVTFADGPGQYKLVVVNAQGRALQMVFDRHVAAEGNTWVTWNGKNEKGQEMPEGQYFVVFYKDGKPLRTVSVFRSKTGQ